MTTKQSPNKPSDCFDFFFISTHFSCGVDVGSLCTALNSRSQLETFTEHVLMCERRPSRKMSWPTPPFSPSLLKTRMKVWSSRFLSWFVVFLYIFLLVDSSVKYRFVCTTTLSRMFGGLHFDLVHGTPTNTT